MRKSILIFITFIAAFIVATVTTTAAAPAPATKTCDPTVAQSNVFLCACSQKATNSAVACQTNGKDPLTGPDGIIFKVERIVAFIAGVAAVIIIVISGFKFITANGDPQAVANARRTLLYALIGLAVLAAAHTIVVFVIKGLQ